MNNYEYGCCYYTDEKGFITSGETIVLCHVVSAGGQMRWRYAVLYCITVLEYMWVVCTGTWYEDTLPTKPNTPHKPLNLICYFSTHVPFTEVCMCSSTLMKPCLSRSSPSIPFSHPAAAACVHHTTSSHSMMSPPSMARPYPRHEEEGKEEGRMKDEG